MRYSWIDVRLPLAAAISSLAALPVSAQQQNLLTNPGFEQHSGIGMIPSGWFEVDENFEYWGWVAPRVEQRIQGIGPRSGAYMVGLDTEMLGVDTNGSDHLIPRSALYQTVTVPGRCSGVFSIYYNDLKSSALSHIAAIRLAYSIDDTNIRAIKTPATAPQHPRDERVPDRAGQWSRPYFRVGQHLPHSQESLGDWSRAALPVKVDTDKPDVKLTLWIGIFENQSGTEIGYYRVDDASFVLVNPSPEQGRAKP